MLDYKHINIDMVGEDGNAMSIMARVQKAMRRADCTPEEITEVLDVMKEGDYNHLLCTVMDVFAVDEDADEWGLDEDVCEGCGENYEYCDCYGEEDDEEEDCA